MNLYELKTKIDKLIEEGKGNTEIYEYDRTSMYASKINNISMMLWYERDLYPIDKENYKYRSMSESEINNIFNNGKKVARFY